MPDTTDDNPLTPPLTDEQLAAVLNEHMVRSIEAPEDFEPEDVTLMAFLADMQAGVEPRYGREHVAYLKALSAEMAGTTAMLEDVASDADDPVEPVDPPG